MGFLENKILGIGNLGNYNFGNLEFWEVGILGNYNFGKWDFWLN